MGIGIDGTNINGATIDGQKVQEITIDGQLAWKRSTLIDSFETDLSAYSYTGGFSINKYRPTKGSKCLRANGGNGNTSLLSMPGDGLPYYPKRGDTIKFDISFDTTGKDFYFGFFHGNGQVEEDSYEIHFETGNNQIALINDTGADHFLDEKSVNYGTDTWYPVEIDTHSGGIDVYFRGTHLSTNHTGRDSGGILFFTSGDRGFWDNLRVIP